MIECQVDYVLRQIRRIEAEGLAWIDIKTEVMDRHNEEIQAAISRFEVWQADCNGYSRSPSGRIVTQWPDDMDAYQGRLAAPDPEAYEVGWRSKPLTFSRSGWPPE